MPPSTVNGHIDGQTVLQTLQHATSSSDVKGAAQQLESWQTKPGYYKYLQTIFITKSLPLEVRYLAVISLKNGIDKYWRKTATNAVNAEDKNVIRSRLIDSGLDEEEHRLALQNALVVAKIVRYEYPQVWPDVITTLLDAVRQSTAQNHGLRLARAQLMLLHVIKELASSRLSRSRQNLNAATPEIVGVLGTLYVDRVQGWQSVVQSHGSVMETDSELLANMELSLLSIRILRRLIVGGYDFPNRSSEVVEFWRLTRNLFETLVRITLQHVIFPQDISTLLDKHLIQLAKLHLKMAQSHPIASALLPDSLAITQTYWNIIKQCGRYASSKNGQSNSDPQLGTNGDKAGDRTALERVTLMGMLLIRAYIKMSCNPTQSLRYRQQHDKDEEQSARKVIKENLLTEYFVSQIIETMVADYFLLRESELWEWEEEPEEWETKEENEGEEFEFSLRPCAERLFLDVCLSFIDVLKGLLMSLFRTVATPDYENIMFKESVYSALGLAAPKIHADVDFDSLLTSTLATEAQKQAPLAHILRRRIAILIGQWITIKISKENRPLVYQVYQHILDPDVTGNDLVVRITAGRHFRNVVDDWEFDADPFLPYAPTILNRLMRLVQEVETMDTKLVLLNTISVTVERVDHHIAPYANQIIELLPPLWEQSGDEHIMKQAILALLTRLVNAMKAGSSPFHGLLIPIIEGVVQPGSESQLYLLDDALDLWHAILQQSEAPASSEVLQLIQYLFNIFELGSESLRKALEILESYVLLSPSSILSDSIRRPLLSSLSTLLGSLRSEESGIVCNIVEVLIRSADTLGSEAAVKQITLDLVETDFLPKQLSGLHETYIAHSGTGPMARTPTVDGLVETDYLSVLSRLCLGSTSTFISFVGEERITWLLDEWFKHMDNISDPSRRKLLTMALTKLLESNQPFILSYLQLLMSLWTDVIGELREINFPDPEDEGKVKDPMTDQLVFDDPSNAGVDGAVVLSPEDERRRVLARQDIVRRVRLPEFVRAYLGMAVQNAGGEERFQSEWLVNVDKEVIAGFGRLGIM